MASRTEADLFSSSPARPSHHRTQLPPSRKPVVSSRPNLKRSASEASLLTPPGSPEKEKPRSVKRSFTESDDEEEDDDQEMASPSGSRSKRKMRSSRIAVKEKRAQGRLGVDNTIVWPRGGRTVGSSRTGPITRAGAITSPVGHQVKSMRLDSDEGELGSPELPRTPGGDVKMKAPAEPTTPTRPKRRAATKAGKAQPVRDSPNNPFLGGSPRAPATTGPFEEQPTMTYVL